MDHVSSDDLLINDLLEDYWFFENLLTRRSRILRYCHSDPYPSSSTTMTSSEKLEDSDSGKTLEAASTRRCLIRAPSIDRREGESHTKLTRQLSEKIRVQEPTQVESFLHQKEPVLLSKSGSRSAPGKIQEASTKHGLIRTPSLPPRIQKREVEFQAKKMINKLTRQFSEKIRVLEPMRPGERFLQKKETMARDKGISERNRTGGNSSSSSGSVKISLQRTQTMPNNIRREEDNEEDEESDSRMGFLILEALASSHNVPKVSSNQRQKPPRSLRSEDTVMVKQGGSSPKTLRKTLSSIETTKEYQRLKGYDQLVEPRVANGLATPPRVPKDSRKEMKDTIKFWARAVASNVRQEC